MKINTKGRKRQVRPPSASLALYGLHQECGMMFSMLMKQMMMIIIMLMQRKTQLRLACGLGKLMRLLSFFIFLKFLQNCNNCDLTCAQR